MYDYRDTEAAWALKKLREEIEYVADRMERGEPCNAEKVHRMATVLYVETEKAQARGKATA